MTHLIGIGGAGMSALAETLMARGEVVSGADRQYAGPDSVIPGSALARLQARGVALYPDDGSGVTEAVTRVVVSTAIEETNPGLRAAQARGIPVVHRAVALAEALAPFKLVAVVGTCGKSSVTALLGHVLAACGFDPFVVNGAAIVGWNGSVRAGKGAYAVAEVDESDKSLVAFNPYAAIVTNASADHYSKDEMDRVFDDFVASATGGPVVDARGEIYAAEDFAAQNVSLAKRMACALGADAAAVDAALETFPGVERRLQKVGTCGAAVVYDDYAHNPEKLSAMIATLRKRHPKGVAVVWRPHGFGPLRKMKDALAASFTAALGANDRLFLLPVYDAGGTADRSVNSDALAAQIPGAKLVADLAAAETALRACADEVGCLVTAGARDPGLPVLARRLSGFNENFK